MTRRWKNRPEGSTWGDFGADDQRGRLNLLTPERTVRAVREVLTRPKLLSQPSAGIARRQPSQREPAAAGSSRDAAQGQPP